MNDRVDDDEIEYEDEDGDEEESDQEPEDGEGDSEANSEEQQAYGEIMADMAYAVASSIPPLSLAVAVSEVAKAAWDLCGAKSNTPEASMAKFQLLMGIISVVPGVGGGFRLAFKTLIKNPKRYASVIFDVVVAILEEANRKFNLGLAINPEEYLKKMIDVPSLQGYLNDIRVKSVAELNEYAVARWSGAPEKLDEYLREVSSQLSMVIEDVLAPVVRMAIAKCLHRKNSAKSGASSQNNNPTTTKSRGRLTDRIRSRFEDMDMSFVIGGVGEHVNDYYCLEQLGWGKGNWNAHDLGDAGSWHTLPNSITLGKLNDNRKLNKNQAITNETGIDGFWRANPVNNQGKEYAIVEAKATTGVARPTTAYVARKLGVLKKLHRGKPIVQMSHKWIEDRLMKLSKDFPADVVAKINMARTSGRLSKLYTRHIIVVSVMVEPGLSHIESMISDNKSDSGHANHNGVTVHFQGETKVQNCINKCLAQHKNGNKGSKDKSKRKNK